MGTGALSPGINWPQYEADHSPQSIAEVKNEWIHTSIPLYAFMAQTGITLLLLTCNH